MLIHTIDAHTAGEPLRLVVDGYPRIEGRTMLERREWLREHHDHLRTALMLEPRGHADMYGAILTEPERPDSDAGVLFMHNQGYSAMCGHGVSAGSLRPAMKGRSCSTRPRALSARAPTLRHSTAEPG
jgi:trans-L-3-hydroxyproline dehydratase